MKIIFLGAPGAGKGTQAKLVSEKLNIPTISTGDLIRKSIKEGTALGLEAKRYITNGALVPDELVIGLIKERLAQSDCDNGFILDGFPRTIEQAVALEKMNIVIDKVVNIVVPDEVIVERTSGRRVCESCAVTYHVLFNPSKTENVCDECGGKLIVRADDLPETVQKRLQVYHAQTEPLEDFYKERNLLIDVIGREELKDTTKATFEALGLND